MNIKRRARETYGSETGKMRETGERASQKEGGETGNDASLFCFLFGSFSSLGDVTGECIGLSQPVSIYFLSFCSVCCSLTLPASAGGRGRLAQSPRSTGRVIG